MHVVEAGNGRYKITGTVSQAGVSAGFHTLVPVYLDFGDDRVLKLGEVHLAGPFTQNVTVELPLPQKPKRALINARNDVLTR